MAAVSKQSAYKTMRSNNPLVTDKSTEADRSMVPSLTLTAFASGQSIRLTMTGNSGAAAKPMMTDKSMAVNKSMMI